MEQWELRTRRIRTIPRHAARDLSRGERIGMSLVALLGLAGLLGALATAWWLALT